MYESCLSTVKIRHKSQGISAGLSAHCSQLNVPFKFLICFQTTRKHHGRYVTEKTIAFYIESKITVTNVLRNIRYSEEKNGLLTCSTVVVSETRSTDT